MTCSACGGVRVDGCIAHRPGCPCYRAVDMFTGHPDLLDLEAELEYWYAEQG